MRLPNWIAHWFKKPEPQQARIPHADEEGDRQRRILLLRLRLSEISGRIDLARRHNKERRSLYAAAQEVRNELIKLGDEA